MDLREDDQALNRKLAAWFRRAGPTRRPPVSGHRGASETLNWSGIRRKTNGSGNQAGARIRSFVNRAAMLADILVGQAATQSLRFLFRYEYIGCVMPWKTEVQLGAVLRTAAMVSLACIVACGLDVLSPAKPHRQCQVVQVTEIDDPWSPEVKLGHGRAGRATGERRRVGG